MPLLRLAALSVALLGILPGMASPQGGSAPPEVRRLQFYVGSWSEDGRMRGDPANDFGAIAGEETCRWAAGGYAVICEESTAGAGGGWEGVYILSYDATAGRYRVYGIEKPGTTIQAAGRIEGDRWIWETDPAPDGSRVRYTFAPAAGSDRTMIVALGTGEGWSPIVEIRYTRRK